MHELGIVSYVARQVEELAETNGLTSVNSVTLAFGEVSGIVPEYIEDCWNWYRQKVPLLKETALLYEIIPALTWCDTCGKTYPTVEYGKTCPHCGSGETWLKQGREINIKQMEAC
ncbi:MAG: hydrogenase maturation nickel metallochaperone HypA [Candidatus Limivicinus sp.]